MTTPMFSLTEDEATELLGELGMPSRVAACLLDQAVKLGYKRAPSGQWLLQVDHTGDHTFTVTIHAKRFAPML